jgi:PAS domain S-box-containing protein
MSVLDNSVKSVVANGLVGPQSPPLGSVEDMGEDVIYGADPFHSAFYGTRMSMVISNPNLPDNPIAFVNASFLAMTGYTRAEIIGRNCRFLQGPNTDPAAIARLSDGIVHRKPVDIEILNYRKDGSTFWNALHVSPVFDKAGKLQYYFGSQIDVTNDREAREIMTREKAVIQHAVKNQTKELHQALLEKTTLLEEMDHRVKNNLAMIRSLVRVQERQIADPASHLRMETLSRQLDAITLTHQRLYMAHNSGRIDIGKFAHELIGDILTSFGRTDIELEANIETIIIRGRHAPTAALILNEIVTNACKHAFNEKDRVPVLSIAASKANKKGVIVIADNGTGFDINAKRSASMGSAIMERLAQQIGWTIETSTSQSGTTVRLSFEANDD